MDGKTITTAIITFIVFIALVVLAGDAQFPPAISNNYNYIVGFGVMMFLLALGTSQRPKQ